MATVAGQMLTTNVLSDQLAIDLSDTISLLEPDAAPLTVFMKAAGKESTEATKFGWLEDVAQARYDAVNNGAGYDNDDTSIVVDHGAYFAQWDLVQNTRTGEIMRVDSVSTNTLTVTRAIGTTGIAMLDNDELLLLGSAQPEGDTSKPAVSDVPSKVQNYTQIIRTPYQASGSLLASGNQVSPVEWARQQRNKGIEHAKSIEYNMLFGRKSATTPGSSEVRTMGGLTSFITTNQTDAGGDLSEPEWNAFLQQVMRFGTGNKLALASGTGVAALNKFPAAKLQTRQNETTYGINVMHFSGPFGSVNVVFHPLMEGAKYGGYIIVADMGEVRYRYLAANGINRDTHVVPNIAANDYDGRKDELLSEVSLKVGQQRKHGVLTGITS